jgi:hypothetical protein
MLVSKEWHQGMAHSHAKSLPPPNSADGLVFSEVQPSECAMLWIMYNLRMGIVLWPWIMQSVFLS